MYDKETRTGGLFTSYIDRFLQLKQEASGYPEWCVTMEDKQRYIEDYYKNEGIRLDPDNIKKNPGMRSLTKLCLNSMWGKFSPRYVFFKHVPNRFLPIMYQSSLT